MEQLKLVLMIKEHIYSVHLEIHMNIWEIDITHCKTLLICEVNIDNTYLPKILLWPKPILPQNGGK